MPPEELRFRLTCEIRKTASRARAAFAPARWNRAHLAGVLSRSSADTSEWRAALAATRGRDYRGAHVALAAHFAQRTSAFPLNARDLGQRARLVRRDFPEAVAHASTRADRIVHGRYDLLGYTGLDFGTPPDWHSDPVHGRRAPAMFWAAVPYLDPLSGDHKIIWELNRHQHWLALGRAHALSGERRFYDAFTSQLTGWLAANPPLVGTNWTSMLELAFRACSWLWALELFGGSAGTQDRDPWLVDLLLGLDRQLTHVEHNLSRYFSPNTHLSGEALALYVAGLALPELDASARRAALGREVLVREASRQVRSDGGHAELSAHYHRYSTDFYLLAYSVARQAGDPASSVFQEAARRQARYLRTITDDSGVRPAIGDDDGGQLFPICGRPPADCRDTLATAAVMLDDPALAIGPVPEEAYWLCGARASEAAPGGTTSWTSAALAASGYFVSRTPGGDHLVFDAGQLGFLNGGHAHADALSCTLSIAGRPVLIDPGTATYTMDEELRHRFRSTMMHNTVVLGGLPQSEQRGPFHWTSRAEACASIWRSSTGCDYMEGTHDGYLPLRHTRGILAIHGVGWCIVDHVAGTGDIAVEHYWHFHPSWRCSLAGPHVCQLQDAGTRLALASSAPLSLLAPGRHPLAAWSPAYGVVEPSPTARGLTTASLPASIATFVPAVPDLSRQLSIEEAAVESDPGPDWHGSAFAVRWSGGALTILAAVERSGKAAHDRAAPPRRWGTAELQTDARVAVLIERATGGSEAVLLNGAVVAMPPTHGLLSLSRRVPLLRLAASTLASSVHEVDAVPL